MLFYKYLDLALNLSRVAGSTKNKTKNKTQNYKHLTEFS